MNTRGLKVGDKVLRVERGGVWGSRFYEAIITQVWPSGRVSVAGRVFNPNGNERGSGPYHGDYLIPFEQEILDKQERKRLMTSKRSMLEDYKLWRQELSDEVILQIAEIVEKAKAK